MKRNSLQATTPVLFIAACWTFATPDASAATRTWNASVSGNTQTWLPGTAFSPSGLNDGDTIIFPNSNVHLRSIYNAGDYDLSRVEFRKAGYLVEKSGNFTRISSRRWQINQTSQSVSLACELANMFGPTVIEVTNAGAGFELDGGIYANNTSGSPITIQGAGNVTVTTLSDDRNPASIIKNGTGTLSIVGDNTLRNATIQLNSGYLFCGGSVWSGNCHTTIGSGGTLLGSGVVGSIENRGIIRPGQTVSSDTRAYTLTVYGPVTSPAGSSASVVLSGYADGSMDSLTVYKTSDFGGSTLLFQLNAGFKPVIGEPITLVRSAGDASSSKPFSNLSEGQLFYFPSQPRIFYQTTYRGGPNGNSMTLTRVATPLPSLNSTMTSGGLQLSFLGQPNTVHQLQYSTDLIHWSNVLQINLGADGTAIETRPLSDPNGFYRTAPIEL
ncbi:MAG: hypothetical protein EOP88_13080 [Verrucomicrobiaceae bacterium]|nr:MAG: hypothetical protein EOP88_13080 [Verrucomicrobiaceae bacterium]